MSYTAWRLCDEVNNFSKENHRQRTSFSILYTQCSALTISWTTTRNSPHRAQNAIVTRAKHLSVKTTGENVTHTSISQVSQEHSFMMRGELSFLTNSGLFHTHITTLFFFSLTSISVTQKYGKVSAAIRACSHRENVKTDSISNIHPETVILKFKKSVSKVNRYVDDALPPRRRSKASLQGILNRICGNDV